MKYVQTFWIDEGKNPLESSFGWSSSKLHLMSWALSCLQLNKFYENVELVTDTKGKELLVDKLKLPYKNIRIELDNLNFDCTPRLWVMKKIYSYTLHTEPFLNIDGDVYMFRSLPEEVLSGALIAQNMEYDFDYYKELVKLINRTFHFVPKFIRRQIATSAPIIASNAGVIGGNNYHFFSDFYQVVQTFVSENKDIINQLTPVQMFYFNAVVEQYIFYCHSKDLNVEVTHLLDTFFDPSFFGTFVDFHLLPTEISFMHALGSYKNSGWVCDQLEHRLKLDYPEYHQIIIDLMESQRNPLDGEGLSMNSGLGFNNSDFSKKYLLKHDDQLFDRTWYIISIICKRMSIHTDLESLSLLQAIQYLENNLTNNTLLFKLKDVFEFEKKRLKIIESLPSDKILLENNQITANSANQIFSYQKRLENCKLKLSLCYKTIESGWDWAKHNLLINNFNENRLEKNLDLDSFYFQTLILIDRYHCEVVEYSLDPIETFLLSNLSNSEFISIHEVKWKIVSFFENLEESKILSHMDTAIRFLSYSGIVIINEIDPY